jgi:hypothetical protein
VRPCSMPGGEVPWTDDLAQGERPAGAFLRPRGKWTPPGLGKRTHLPVAARTGLRPGIPAGSRWSLRTLRGQDNGQPPGCPPSVAQAVSDTARPRSAAARGTPPNLVPRWNDCADPALPRVKADIPCMRRSRWGTGLRQRCW